MPLFIWKPSYEIGVADLDMQHRRLVGMINELFDAMKEGHSRAAVDHILDGLTEYVQLHFSTEERLMQQHHYPHFETHGREHLELTEHVLELNDRRRRGERIATPELLDFLKGWMETHISVSDRAFGDFLKKSRNLLTSGIA